MKPAMKTTNPAQRSPDSSKNEDFENLKRRIHGKLVDKLDLNRIGELEGEVLRTRNPAASSSTFATPKIRC